MKLSPISLQWVLKPCSKLLFRNRLVVAVILVVLVNSCRECVYIPTMSDILVECDVQSLISMLNVLKHNLPEHTQQYNYIYNYLYHYDKISGNRKDIYSDRWNTRFYTHRNGELRNCTLITIPESLDYCIVCFTLQESQVELKECLQKTNLIRWDIKPFEIGCDETHFKVVNDVVCQKIPTGWLYPPMEHIMYISKEKIEELPLNEKLPEDLYLAPLDAELHSKVINDHWDYKAQNSLCLIRQSIELNGGIGLFRRGDPQPLSWIATSDFFAPGFLHTIKSERSKGYAQLIMKLELKRLMKIHGIDLFTFVTVKNESSLALHRKLGFETVNRITWIQKSPVAASL